MPNILIPCPACGRELKIRDRNLLGKRGKCPSCQHLFLLEEPATLELAEPDSPFATIGPHRTPEPKLIVQIAPPREVGPVAVAPVVTTRDAPGIARLKGLQRKRGISRWISVAAGVLVVIVGAGIAYLIVTSGGRDAGGARTIVDASNSTPNAISGGDSPQNSLTASPTEGKPIPLEMIPAGARLFVHLRPADLWRSDGPGEEFRFCLGPLGEYVEAQIKSLCKYPPDQVEELLFAWISGPRGTPPDFVYVVRLKHDAKKSDLLEVVGGERDDSHSQPVYVSGDRAGVIADLKTFAIGPASMAGEMAGSLARTNPMPDGVVGLLPLSDRTRHITVLFEPTSVLLDEEFLAPEIARPFLRTVMDWFGDDAETVLWSVHLQRDRFYSEVHVRNQTGLSPIALQDRLRERLDELPKDLLTAVRSMHPQELGKRKVIGRVPAMSMVFALATEMTHGPRHVQLVTPLPDRAAPNLALGTLLAWDESTRTDFSKQPSARPGGDSGALPATVVERLKKVIDVDFRKEPLYGAFDYIASETSVAFDIDGDALKLGGYTKNMEQNMKLDRSPAVGVLAAILKQYDKMCLVVDEPKKSVMVTTFAAAEQQGLKPYPLP